MTLLTSFCHLYCLLTLNRFHHCYGVSNANFEQVNAGREIRASKCHNSVGIWFLVS